MTGRRLRGQQTSGAADVRDDARPAGAAGGQVSGPVGQDGPTWGRGNGRATVYTVAAHAGVSVATVSRVLQAPEVVRASTRTRVLEAIDALDYVPHGAARSLAARQHEAHGLVLPELRGPYYAELLVGYESAAAEGGDSVLLLVSHGKADLDGALRRLAANVDGLVVMSGVRVGERTLEALRRSVPVVGLGHHWLGGLETVATENFSSAETLTRHLLGHGRRRVVFAGDPDLAPDIQERYEGFVAAHDGAPVADPLRVGLREEHGHELTGRVLGGEVTADAVLCGNDEVALALMEGLQAGGVAVPDDVAVTGWDDLMAARYVRPALTTVQQPVRELGARAARRMRALLAGHDAPPDAPPEDHRLATTVVLRRSCGCPARPSTTDAPTDASTDAPTSPTT